MTTGEWCFTTAVGSGKRSRPILQHWLHIGRCDCHERISILLHLSKAAYEATELSTAEQACRAILEMDANNANAIEYLAKIFVSSAL